MAYLTPHVSLSSTSSQVIASPNVSQSILFDTQLGVTKFTHTVTGASSSKITFNESGDYTVFFNAQIESLGANKTMDIWAKLTGSNVINSNSKTTLVDVNDQKRISTVLFLNISASMYLEYWMMGDSTNLSLKAYAANNIPATPSVYIVVDKMK